MYLVPQNIPNAIVLTLGNIVVLYLPFEVNLLISSSFWTVPCVVFLWMVHVFPFFYVSGPCLGLPVLEGNRFSFSGRDNLGSSFYE